MTDMVHEGGCGCGALRYRVSGDPIFVNNCHCTLCQRQTGSTSVVNALFEIERLEVLSGELSENTVPGGSGDPHVIVRCAACGVAVWSHYGRFRGQGPAIRVGTLDDSAAFRPDAVIYTADAMPWAAFPQDIPRFDESYNHREVLPPERFERLKALVKRAAG